MQVTRVVKILQLEHWDRSDLLPFFDAHFGQSERSDVNHPLDLYWEWSLKPPAKTLFELELMWWKRRDRKCVFYLHSSHIFASCPYFESGRLMIGWKKSKNCVQNNMTLNMSQYHWNQRHYACQLCGSDWMYEMCCAELKNTADISIFEGGPRNRVYQCFVHLYTFDTKNIL